MINLDFGILIDRPVHDVFTFVTTVTNIPKWQSQVKEIKTQDAVIKVGSKCTTVAEMLGRKIEGVMEVTEYQPDALFGFKMQAGPMEVNAKISFKTVGTGTKISLNAQGNPGGVFKIAEGALAGQVKHLMEGNLARLKDQLEKPA